MAGYNVSGVTRTAVGRWTIAFTTALADNAYAVTGSNDGSYAVVAATARATNAVAVRSVDPTTGTYVDGVTMQVVVFR